MNATRTALALLASLALLTGSPAVLAGNGNGNGNGKGNPHKDHGKQNEQGYSNNSWNGSGPSIDVGGVRVILNDNRDYWSPASNLPPGIQKNLARGKPLPPGIAKKLDGRLVGQLPHYDGYEWQQVGTDLVLVTIATGIIYQVLQGVMH